MEDFVLGDHMTFEPGTIIIEDEDDVGARLFHVVDFMPDPTPDTEEVPYEIRLALWRIFNVADLDHNGTLDASEVCGGTSSCQG